MNIYAFIIVFSFCVLFRLELHFVVECKRELGCLLPSLAKPPREATIILHAEDLFTAQTSCYG